MVHKKNHVACLSSMFLQGVLGLSNGMTKWHAFSMPVKGIAWFYGQELTKKEKVHYET